jgi:hypothetical protein
MSRALAIIATAAVAGTAFAAAVTLPTLVTLGSDSPPESLAVPANHGAPVTVVHAAPLASPRAHRRGKRAGAQAGGGLTGTPALLARGAARLVTASRCVSSRPSSRASTAARYREGVTRKQQEHEQHERRPGTAEGPE